MYENNYVSDVVNMYENMEMFIRGFNLWKLINYEFDELFMFNVYKL